MREKQRALEGEINWRRARTHQLRAALGLLESLLADEENKIQQLIDELSQAARDEAEGKE
jgi:hypothetical protein